MLNLNCVICAELFLHSDDVHVTTCGHMFHFVCLKQWMERSKSCPQCRNRCTDRNIFRVYFNLANLDVSRIDVGSLQEKLDNANLQIKIMEKDARKAEEQIKSLKEMQKMCMKTISALEKKIQKTDFIILSYTEQMKMLKTDAKLVDDLRNEVKALKHQIETMEGVSTILTSTHAEVEKMLKNENDPRKLTAWVATLKRELRICENKKSDLRNVLKIVQNDLRKEIDIKKTHEERISQLESENYQLNEKIKLMQTEADTAKANRITNPNKTLSISLINEEKRLTISPTIKDNIKKIEESNSPYLNIKSSSIGLVPLFKRNFDTHSASDNITMAPTTTKLATIKISPVKSQQSGSSTNSSNRSIGAGALRKTASDMTEKYSIFKKPRLGLTDANTHAGSMKRWHALKPLASNMVFNGFGGTEKVDPFARNSDHVNDVDGYDDDDDDDDMIEVRPARKVVATSTQSTVPKTNMVNLNNRLKLGGLRNFKVNK